MNAIFFDEIFCGRVMNTISTNLYFKDYRLATFYLHRKRNQTRSLDNFTINQFILTYRPLHFIAGCMDTLADKFILEIQVITICCLIF
jgi:hypothetical protein